MAKSVLIIVNDGPEDPNRATVPFLTAKACVDKGMEVSIWLYNNAIYLMCEGVTEHVQAAGLPTLEDLVLYLTLTKSTPIYIGVSCAVGRGMLNEDHSPRINFAAGELAGPATLAELIEKSDTVISF